MVNNTAHNDALYISKSTYIMTEFPSTKVQKQIPLQTHELLHQTKITPHKFLDTSIQLASPSSYLTFSKSTGQDSFTKMASATSKYTN